MFLIESVFSANIVRGNTQHVCSLIVDVFSGIASVGFIVSNKVLHSTQKKVYHTFLDTISHLTET